MILSDKDIRQALQDKRISISPFLDRCVQAASVDLHLDKTFLIFKHTAHVCIDLKKPVEDFMDEVVIDDERPFILHPGEFALGLTLETVGVGNDMVGRLEGKSSLGRLGIIVHATAGYLDPGNELQLTLELHNIGNLPVTLYYKMPIAQMSFSPLSSVADKPYDAKKKYYKANKPQASKMYLNYDPTKNEWL